MGCGKQHLLAQAGVLRGFSGCGVPIVRLTANPCAALARTKIYRFTQPIFGFFNNRDKKWNLFDCRNGSLRRGCAPGGGGRP